VNVFEALLYFVCRCAYDIISGVICNELQQNICSKVTDQTSNQSVPTMSALCTGGGLHQFVLQSACK